jgi:hypothetical protein
LSSHLLSENLKIRIYKTIILPVVRYGCETLREEYRLRRIFGPKRDEIITGGRKLHNKELHNLYSSPNRITMIKSNRITWTGYVARTVEKRNSYRISVGKSEGKRPLGRQERNWVGNIEMDLIMIGLGGMG